MSNPTDKQAREEEIAMLMRMAHSPVDNYVIPGLTSWLVGQPGPNGCIRLFVNKREHEENITPHSHRFDFHARVLRGGVRNVIWEPVSRPGLGERGDTYQKSTLIYGGAVGRYIDKKVSGTGDWIRRALRYEAGDTYSMKANQVHSIFFERDTIVQFFEGPTVVSTSVVLEPIVDGEVVPTFEVRPWMFKRPAPEVSV